MSILRPQKILFSNLRKIDNLLDELSKSKELDNISIENYRDEHILLILYIYNKINLYKISIINLKER